MNTGQKSQRLKTPEVPLRIVFCRLRFLEWSFECSLLDESSAREREVPGLERYSSTRVRCTRARGGITAPPLQLVVNLKLTRNDGTQSLLNQNGHEWQLPESC